jgi:hypothetical protein
MVNRPVLIRGLNVDAPGWKVYTVDALQASHQDLHVHVSDIPYNQKFGSENGEESTLGRYIEQIHSHHIAGEEYPWSVKLYQESMDFGQ